MKTGKPTVIYLYIYKKIPNFEFFKFQPGGFQQFCKPCSELNDKQGTGICPEQQFRSIIIISDHYRLAA
jgi:hypothetical protein